MKYGSFQIENFKGIESLKIDLQRQPHTPVTTLVGLNESGKTTILEAIHWLARPDKYKDHELIPKHSLGSFDGAVSVEAELLLSEEDWETLEAQFGEWGYKGLVRESDTIKVRRRHVFRASEVSHKSAQADASISLKKGRGHKAREYSEYAGLSRKLSDHVILSVMPEILYYQNFLFNIPDRIYLSGEMSETPSQAPYRRVIQDILTASNKNYTIQKHLIDRSKPGVLGFSQEDKIEAVLNDAELHLTRTVVESWKDILGSEDQDLKITLGRSLKRDDNGVYLEIKVREKGRDYSVQDRSLGFRWFLAFLLFTHYRGYREPTRENALFLLDEPASNLHPAAQGKLLKEFDKLPHSQSVIYSTHSHHMIEPEWLHNTYVVSNSAANYKDAILSRYGEVTSISAQRYFPFVSDHPNDTDLYRPILDALDYRPSKLEMVPEVVITEGKNDYYALGYLARGSGMATPNVYPSTGKDRTEYAASLYLAWGRPFIAILDSDRGGERTKTRLDKAFGSIVSKHIFTLKDVDSNWANCTYEDLIEKNEQKRLVKSEFGTTEVSKSKLNTAIQSSVISGGSIKLGRHTGNKAKKLLAFIEAKLDALR